MEIENTPARITAEKYFNNMVRAQRKKWEYRMTIELQTYEEKHGKKNLGNFMQKFMELNGYKGYCRPQ